MTGMHAAILEIVRKYNKEIPLDFVAGQLGRRQDEIGPYVKNLEKAGIVRVNGDYISYVKEC